MDILSKSHKTIPIPWWHGMAPAARYEVAPTVVNFTRSLLVSFAQPLGELTESGLSNTKGACWKALAAGAWHLEVEVEQKNESRNLILWNAKWQLILFVSDVGSVHDAMGWFFWRCSNNLLARCDSSSRHFGALRFVWTRCSLWQTS